MKMPNATFPGLEGGKGSWTIAVTAQIEAELRAKGACLQSHPEKEETPTLLAFLTYLHPNEGSVRP